MILFQLRIRCDHFTLFFVLLPVIDNMTKAKGKPMTRAVKIKHSKVCQHDGCTRKPEYGLTGVGARRCRAHQTTGMVNLKHKMCHCGKHPSFGLQGESATCCKHCKTEDMVDVLNPRCGCAENKQPTYAMSGDRPSKCVSCKLPGMVNVKSRCCGCPANKHPTFGEPGERATKCASCRLPGMIDVLNRRCGCPANTRARRVQNRRRVYLQKLLSTPISRDCKEGFADAHRVVSDC